MIAPTKANLATLTAQIPVGFTQGKIPGMGDYTNIGGHWALTIQTAS